MTNSAFWQHLASLAWPLQLVAFKESQKPVMMWFAGQEKISPALKGIQTQLLVVVRLVVATVEVCSNNRKYCC